MGSEARPPSKARDASRAAWSGGSPRARGFVRSYSLKILAEISGRPPSDRYRSAIRRSVLARLISALSSIALKSGQSAYAWRSSPMSAAPIRCRAHTSPEGSASSATRRTPTGSPGAHPACCHGHDARAETRGARDRSPRPDWPSTRPRRSPSSATSLHNGSGTSSRACDACPRGTSSGSGRNAPGAFRFQPDVIRSAEQNG